METLERLADPVAVALAIMVLVFYLARIDLLRYFRHRTVLVVLHVFMAGLCMFSLESVAVGRGGLLPLIAAVSAALHLLSSFAAWPKGRVPEYYNSDRAPLGDPIDPAATRPPHHMQRS